MEPTTGQLVLLSIAVLLFGIGGGASVARLWWGNEKTRLLAKACMYGGVVVSIAVIVWHSFDRGGWIPIQDNFDALIWLAVLLSLFVMYMQRAKPINGLEWFIMPMVILLLIGAGFFGKKEFHGYAPVQDIWLWTHRVTSYGGTAAFAIAAAAGLMYVISNQRLRRKLPKKPGIFASLERLEHITMVSVTLGFALLTVGLVTGGVRWMDDKHTNIPKVVLACLAWVVYAVVLHAPINPRFRGKRAAMLSVVGFVLVMGTILAVQLM